MLPDEIVLSYCVPRNTFFDKKSKELGTDRVKGKYKLLFKIIKEIDIFTFFILTSSKDSGVRDRVFKISLSDWADRDRNHLENEFSYVDIQKFEVLSKVDVLSRMRGGNNNFSYAGKLNSFRFNEFKLSVQGYLDMTTVKTDINKRELLRSIVNGEITQPFMKKYDI